MSEAKKTWLKRMFLPNFVEDGVGLADVISEHSHDIQPLGVWELGAVWSYLCRSCGNICCSEDTLIFLFFSLRSSYIGWSANSYSNKVTRVSTRNCALCTYYVINFSQILDLTPPHPHVIKLIMVLLYSSLLLKS